MKSYLCVYKNCGAKIGKNSSLKFARFVKPRSDLARTVRWLGLIGRPDLKSWMIDEFSVICEKHFLDNVDLDWRKNPSLEPIPSFVKVFSTKSSKKKLISNSEDSNVCVNKQQTPRTYSRDMNIKTVTIPIISGTRAESLGSIDINGKD